MRNPKFFLTIAIFITLVFCAVTLLVLSCERCHSGRSESRQVSDPIGANDLSDRQDLVVRVEAGLAEAEAALALARNAYYQLRPETFVRCGSVLRLADRVQVEDLARAVDEMREAVGMVREDLQRIRNTGEWGEFLASRESARSLTAAVICCSQAVIIASQMIQGGDYNARDLFCSAQVERDHRFALSSVLEDSDDPRWHVYNQLLSWQEEIAGDVTVVLSASRPICPAE